MLLIIVHGQPQEKIRELEVIELMPQSVYSPELAPSVYQLFQFMAHSLRGKHYHNIHDVQLASKFTRGEGGIPDMASRWCKTIQHNGLYFEV